jgi:hypothetical protein
MAFLSAALPYITAASTVLTTAAAVQQGQARKTEMEALARARDEEANAEAAEGQRAALIERRKAKNLMSRARAVAAASGAGVSDPTVVNQMTDIETQGEVNALNAMYAGRTAERGYRRGAAIARNEADASQTAGYLGAASTALDGATSWMDKYGGKKKYGTK